MKKVTRRKFLNTSATATTAAAFAAAPAAAASKIGQTSPNDKIGVALIGSGGMGRNDLRQFLRIPEVECRAICDVDRDHLNQGIEMVEQQRGNRPDGHEDFRRVLDREDVDAVIVGTPDHWHALNSVLACQAGKDVYVEKPLATTIAEGRAMVDAARRYNRVVQVGTQQRSGRHFQQAVDFVRSGELGKIRLVRAWAYLDWKSELGNPPDGQPPETANYDLWLGPAPKRPFNPARFHFTFRWFWDYSGGLMTDWGAHMVDVAMWAMEQDPIGAMAGGGKYGYPDDIMETPDTQQSIVQFPAFNLIWEHMLGVGVGPWQREHGVAFHGENGILIVDRGGWEVHSETNSEDRPGRIFKMKPVPRQGGSGDFHFAHINNFIDCVKSRQRPLADVELSHKSVNACHLGNIAVRLQTRVGWDAKTEKLTGPEEAQALVGREYRAPWKLPKLS